MRRIDFGVVLIVIAVAFGTQQLEAQVQRLGQSVTNFSHNIGTLPNLPVSPFFTEATGNGTLFNFIAERGLAGDLVSGAGDTTNVSGTVTIVGTSNASTNFNDGNRLPSGVTLTYDVSFAISTNDGLLVTAGGNTGNGLAPGALPDGAFDLGEAIEFSPATISNVSFTGAPVVSGVTFTPGTVSGVGLSQFRSNNFGEAANGAILDNGTDSIGFGVSSGTVASQVPMNNGFGAAARFPAMMMDVPVTLTSDQAATGTFNLKGFELTTFFDFEFVSPLSGMRVALTDFSHNINPGPFSPFFTEGTGVDGTVFNYTPENGLFGSIVAGAADTTTVSGTVTIVGTSTAASGFSDGNQLPEGVTLAYDLNFTISSPDGLLTVAFANTGDGIGVGPGQNETLDNGEQLVFSPATISNVTFTGQPLDGSNFVPGDVVDVAFDAFRTNNFGEAADGAVLSNGTDSVGFGLASGTLASNVDIDNGFVALDRFPAMSLLNQLTLTADAGATSFNLKGFELVTAFTFDMVANSSCDVNLDGEVNFADISPFIEALSSTVFLPSADCNGDGDVNFADIAPFIAALAAS